MTGLWFWRIQLWNNFFFDIFIIDYTSLYTILSWWYPRIAILRLFERMFVVCAFGINKWFEFIISAPAMSNDMKVGTRTTSHSRAFSIAKSLPPSRKIGWPQTSLDPFPRPRSSFRIVPSKTSARFLFILVSLNEVFVFFKK